MAFWIPLGGVLYTYTPEAYLPQTSLITAQRAFKEGERVGYVRVSSADQNTDRQLDGLHTPFFLTVWQCL